MNNLYIYTPPPPCIWQGLGPDYMCDYPIGIQGEQIDWKAVPGYSCQMLFMDKCPRRRLSNCTTELPLRKSV